MNDAERLATYLALIAAFVVIAVFNPFGSVLLW